MSKVYSGVTYSSPAVGTTTFALTSDAGNAIEYLSQDHIKVESSTDAGVTWSTLTVTTDYTFNSNGTEIVLVTPTVAGQQIRISRHTRLSAQYVTFSDGSLLTSKQLNKAEQFSLFCDQEIVDGNVNFDPSAIGLDDTDDLPEGSVNLYYTDARVEAWINTNLADTDALAEGSTNLYYTDARVEAYVSGAGYIKDAGVTEIAAGTNVTIDPADGKGKVTINATGGGSSGVTKIIAGTNVTIDPSGGTGDVTINATGGGGGAVESVNGKTGAVVLSASDVGALGSTDTAADSDKLGGTPAADFAKTADLANVWEFKGVLDPTTVDPPADPGVGDVYACDTAGSIRAAWNVTADSQPNPNPISTISIGSLIGRGTNQWAVIGDANAEVLQSLDSVLAVGNTSARNIVLTGDVTANKFKGDGSELTNLPSAPVSSVNSKTGDVVLAAGDVGAATAAQGTTADSAVQPGDNVSELTNDAGYITAGEVPTPATPTLQSVTDEGNNTTNNITLDTDKIVLNADGSATFVGQITSAGVKNSGLDFSLNDGEGYNLQSDGRLFFQIKNSRGSGWSIVESYRGINKRFDISGNGRITGGQNLHDSSTKVTNYEISPSGAATFAGKVDAAGYRIDELATITSTSP